MIDKTHEKVCVRICGIAFLMICCLLFGGCKEPSEDTGILWQKGEIISGKEELIRFLQNPNEGESISIGYQDVFPDEKLSSWIITYKDKSFHLMLSDNDIRTYSYGHYIQQEVDGENKTFYVLSDSDRIDGRALWRTMWRMPQLRHDATFVLLWEGTVQAVDENCLNTVRDNDQKEARILLGIDAFPVYWPKDFTWTRDDLDLTGVPEKGTVLVKNHKLISDTDSWELFLEKTENNQASRILIIEQMTGENAFTKIEMVFYDGTYIDVRNQYGGLQNQDFRFLIKDNTRRAGRTGYFLCKDRYIHPSTHPVIEIEPVASMGDVSSTEFANEPVYALFYIDN